MEMAKLFTKLILTKNFDLIKTLLTEFWVELFGCLDYVSVNYNPRDKQFK